MTIEKKTGFYLWLTSDKEFFFESEKKNKTKSIAKAIINILNQKCGYNLPDNAEAIDFILWRTDKATYELKETDEKHIRYLDIYNDCFHRGDINVCKVFAI